MQQENHKSRKTIARVTGITAITVLGLMGQAAQAQLATDLDCVNCVGNQELGPASVFKGNIANFTITGNKIAPEAIGTGKIKDNAITSGKLAGASVGTGKLKDGAVTADKLDPALSLASGFVSVSANGSQARDSSFLLEQGPNVDGRTAIHAVTGQGSEFLVVPVQLPHGATITSFTYTIFDNDAAINSSGIIWRDDSTSVASVASSASSATVMTVSTSTIAQPVVDNSQYSYWVFMGVDGAASNAGADISPVNAVIGFTY